MQIMLAKAYDRHVKAVRSRQQADHGRAVIDRSEVKKSVIPVLSGLTGIGKTACVKQFVSQKGFELLEVDCSTHVGDVRGADRGHSGLTSRPANSAARGYLAGA